MEHSSKLSSNERTRLRFNYGTFGGFNSHSQSAIERILTAEDVVNWDHERDGEAEFWPSGDRPEVALLFSCRNKVTASELLVLDRLLDELGDDSTENILRIYHAAEQCAGGLIELTAEGVQKRILHLFFGDDMNIRTEAAYGLFKLYYPEDYKAWLGATSCALYFDMDYFLDSPFFSLEEVRIGQQSVLLVSPQ